MLVKERTRSSCNLAKHNQSNLRDFSLHGSLAYHGVEEPSPGRQRYHPFSMSVDSRPFQVTAARINIYFEPSLGLPSVANVPEKVNDKEWKI